MIVLNPVKLRLVPVALVSVETPVAFRFEVCWLVLDTVVIVPNPVKLRLVPVALVSVDTPVAFRLKTFSALLLIS